MSRLCKSDLLSALLQVLEMWQNRVPRLCPVVWACVWPQPTLQWHILLRMQDPPPLRRGSKRAGGGGGGREKAAGNDCGKRLHQWRRQQPHQLATHCGEGGGGQKTRCCAIAEFVAFCGKARCRLISQCGASCNYLLHTCMILSTKKDVHISKYVHISIIPCAYQYHTMMHVGRASLIFPHRILALQFGIRAKTHARQFLTRTKLTAGNFVPAQN